MVAILVGWQSRSPDAGAMASDHAALRSPGFAWPHSTPADAGAPRSTRPTLARPAAPVRRRAVAWEATKPASRLPDHAR